MKYHTQEHLYEPDKGMKGSCYPTVYACLLDLELHEVPYFHLFYWTGKEKLNLNHSFRKRFLHDKPEEECMDNEKENYRHNISIADNLWDTVRSMWLASKGLREVFVRTPEECPKGEPYMVSGLSPRGIEHVVIFQNGEMIHDPHPSRDGLIKLKEHFAYSFLELTPIA